VITGIGPGFPAVNPVTNKIYVTNSSNNNMTVIDEAPVADTKVRANIDPLPNHATTLARPFLTGSGVNQWTPNATHIEGVAWGLNSAQKSWQWTTINSGSGTNSVGWAVNWGNDSLIKGENFVLGIALESDAATTNNLGLGTPFAGNLIVYPAYRIDQPVTATRMAGVKLKGTERIRPIYSPFISWITIPGHSKEQFELYNVAGKLMGTYYGNRIGQGLSAGLYYLRSKAGNEAPLMINKLR
jgi:hypothetical protein